MRTSAPISGFALIVIFTAALSGCAPVGDGDYEPAADSLRFAGEEHLRNIRQLTFGGNNAEAYWSPDGEQLVFQSEWSALTQQGCDQIFVMNADGTPRDSGNMYDLVSTDTGRTTCSYFMPDGRVVFASTHGASAECPIAPMFGQGRYVWPVFPEYDIYVADADGQNVELLIGGPGYDAEATVSPDGQYIIFTSTRTGDLELWRYEIATGDLLQLTDELGYDGGAFFSPDSQMIVWRADRPEGERAEVYQNLLQDDLVEPSELNIFVANIDGSNPRQVTNLPGANWAPFFHPSGEKVLFSTNHHVDGGRIFDIFMVNLDGTDMKQLTHSGTFDAFPMFSPDGTKLVFSSNRNGAREPSSDTNVFVADWVEEPGEADRTFGTD
ncbi:MAG: PD40 domain-containing protein [Rhodothermales bacterium]|nr:PD40 domain-containing protein [Rhodothermales bacterium]MBO6780296.1 PD40 domain-containing protein [Rhodothermales bacterium]